MRYELLGATDYRPLSVLSFISPRSARVQQLRRFSLVCVVCLVKVRDLWLSKGETSDSNPAKRGEEVQGVMAPESNNPSMINQSYKLFVSTLKCPQNEHNCAKLCPNALNSSV
jgi:hypothetical protein